MFNKAARWRLKVSLLAVFFCSTIFSTPSSGATNLDNTNRLDDKNNKSQITLNIEPEGGAYIKIGRPLSLICSISLDQPGFNARIKLIEKSNSSRVFTIHNNHASNTQTIQLNRGRNIFRLTYIPYFDAAQLFLEVHKIQAEKQNEQKLILSKEINFLEPIPPQDKLLLTIAHDASKLRLPKSIRIQPAHSLFSLNSKTSSCILLGELSTQDLTAKHIATLKQYVLEGGQVILASYRTLYKLRAALLNGATPRTLEAFQEQIKFADTLKDANNNTLAVRYPLGFGRVVVMASNNSTTLNSANDTLRREITTALTDTNTKNNLIATSLYSNNTQSSLGNHRSTRARTLTLLGALVITALAALLQNKTRTVKLASLSLGAVLVAAIGLLVLGAAGASVTSQSVILYSFDATTLRHMEFITLKSPPHDVPINLKSNAAIFTPLVARNNELGKIAFELSTSSSEQIPSYRLSTNLLASKSLIVYGETTRQCVEAQKQDITRLQARGNQFRATRLTSGIFHLTPIRGELPTEIKQLIAPLLTESGTYAWEVTQTTSMTDLTPFDLSTPPTAITLVPISIKQ